MNCRECTDFLIDYLNGDLPAAQQRVFEGHIQLCPPCLTYLESYRATVKTCEMAHEDPQEPIPEAMVQAILAARAVKHNKV
ncbi:MAG TPA: zf-HC2 domain-containing protein [Myxococcota bacterium]|nr:zf-HC2 domain-containing protein [Myxococcota bacterium]